MVEMRLLISKLRKEAKASRYRSKGDKAFEKGRYRQAIDHYHVVLNYVTPHKNPNIYDSIAISYYQLGCFIESLLYASTAINYYTDPLSNFRAEERVKLLQNLIKEIQIHTSEKETNS